MPRSVCKRLTGLSLLSQNIGLLSMCASPRGEPCLWMFVASAIVTIGATVFIRTASDSAGYVIKATEGTALTSSSERNAWRSFLNDGHRLLSHGDGAGDAVRRPQAFNFF